jgi:YggT family protein
MSVLGSFLGAIVEVLHIVLTIYSWIVIVAALISWVNPDPYNPIVRFLYSVTEPLFATVRRLLPFQYRGIDFSPLIVLLIIVFLDQLLVNTLYPVARNLQ